MLRAGSAAREVIAAALAAHAGSAARVAKALHEESVAGLPGHEVHEAKARPLASGHRARLVRVAREVPVRQASEVRAPRVLSVRRARLARLQSRRNKLNKLRHLCLLIPVIGLLRLSKVRRVQRSNQKAERESGCFSPT